MRYLPANNNDPNLLVGIDHSDDGSVYKLTDNLALIQSLDFFTPIVDDPYMFGQIAAANALSDIYAMGGTPKTALNIVAYPINELGPEILAEILKGSSDKVRESGALVAGGHSIDDREPKFGLSVTGIVHPDNFYKNSGAKPGDALILTKPIGAGIQTTAIKQERLTTEEINHVSQIMATLNKYAAESLKIVHPNAVTDITGFGLLGHAFEMADGSDVSLIIHHNDVPLISRTKELAEDNCVPGGSKANFKWLKDDVEYAIYISNAEQLILCDAVTSGGLLISLPKQDVDSFMEDFKTKHNMQAAVIGEVTEKRDKAIYIK